MLQRWEYETAGAKTLQGDKMLHDERKVLFEWRTINWPFKTKPFTVVPWRTALALSWKAWKKKKMERIKFALSFLLLISLCHTEIVYVSPEGKDDSNCGSLSSPCKTLNFAVNKSDGRIWLLEGTYTVNCKVEITQNMQIFANFTKSATLDLHSFPHGNFDCFFEEYN